jgi:hypothetical protein
MATTAINGLGELLERPSKFSLRRPSSNCERSTICTVPRTWPIAEL